MMNENEETKEWTRVMQETMILEKAVQIVRARERQIELGTRRLLEDIFGLDGRGD